MIRDAAEAIRAAPYTVCVGSDRHVVHPADYERGGYMRCAGCFRVFYVPTQTDAA